MEVTKVEKTKRKVKFEFELEIETIPNGMWLHTKIGEGTFDGKKIRFEDAGSYYVLAETIKENNWLSHCISKEKLIYAITEGILKTDAKAEERSSSHD